MLNTTVVTAARCMAIHRYNLTSFHCVSSMHAPLDRVILREHRSGKSNIPRCAAGSRSAINGLISRNKKNRVQSYGTSKIVPLPSCPPKLVVP